MKKMIQNHKVHSHLKVKLRTSMFVEIRRTHDDIHFETSLLSYGRATVSPVSGV